MPGTLVLYKDNFMDSRIADVITRVVATYGVTWFNGNPEVSLNDTDFSFKFLDPNQFDKLSHDIIIRIGPSFAATELTLKAHASRIATAIVTDFVGVMSRDASVGVEVMVDGRKGWAELTYHAVGIVPVTRPKVTTVPAPRRHTPGA